MEGGLGSSIGGEEEEDRLVSGRGGERRGREKNDEASTEKKSRTHSFIASLPLVPSSLPRVVVRVLERERRRTSHPHGSSSRLGRRGRGVGPVLEDRVTLLNDSSSVGVDFELRVEHEGAVGAAVGGDSGDEVLDGGGGHACFGVGVEWEGREGERLWWLGANSRLGAGGVFERFSLKSGNI